MPAHQPAEIDHHRADVGDGPVRRGRALRGRTGRRRDRFVAGRPEQGVQQFDLLGGKGRPRRPVGLLAGQGSQVRDPTGGDGIEGQTLAPIVGTS